MDKKRFISILKSDSKLLEHRKILVNAVLNHQDWVIILLNDMSNINDKQSNFSARILELSCKKGHLEIIIPYFDEFSSLLPKIKFDGVVRASAKIIELLMVEYFIKKNMLYLEKISTKHLEQFTETCFDWMITNRAIAIQAHAMYSLYLLGSKFDWILPELIENIERNLPSGSTGYKNRGRKVIKAITTKKILKL